jgi:cytochrome d ubiquinol oxidase subunit II
MLADVPMVLILVGLAAYAVLAFADFGAGFWTLFAGGGRAGVEATRDHARHAMGPVWEANHVWLIFVLATCWTAYPVAFGSITSTLSIPLFLAAVGIIMRGTAYALRSQLDEGRSLRLVEFVFALSSILVPFALGTVVGAIASGRVPVGNARGDRITSWTGATSIVIGLLSVAAGAYLAAVYLAADARRLGEQTLERDFRVRALAAGVVAGALALAGLLVVRSDVPRLWHGLTTGAGLAMVVLSAAAGVATLALVGTDRFGPARASAAVAVAAIIAGWAFAQKPVFLPGLTIEQAAAGHATLVAVVISAAAGAVVLVPSLVLLFRLFLLGRLDTRAPARPDEPARPRISERGRRRALEAFAAVTLVAGVGATAFADPGWARAVGVVCLFAAAISTFRLLTVEPDEEGSLDVSSA